MSRHEPIAIVGMGIRFPGGACDAESFARLLWSERMRSLRSLLIDGRLTLFMRRILMRPEK